jgi:hypothetical protein
MWEVKHRCKRDWLTVVQGNETVRGVVKLGV